MVYYWEQYQLPVWQCHPPQYVQVQWAGEGLSQAMGPQGQEFDHDWDS